MKIRRCFRYLITMSIITFFVGRVLPKKWFCYDRFPYRVYSFEKGGEIYNRINIRSWQKKVPDMSKVFTHIMPPKKLTSENCKNMPRMIQETCVAEFIHAVNCILGFYCLKIFPGIGGIIVVFIYAVVFNLPYILIQRYNRPRLIRLYKHLKQRRMIEMDPCARGEMMLNENVDIELQHG